ncbi:MAG TPA: AraC family transcriptional regulator [Lachnospiraceae bacterium]|nr:AraC family transcriptional regulator [Lachnospiraceae bacterium]
MKYLEYREKRQQGTFDFPIAFYRVGPAHPRYMMPYHWHPEFELIRILEGNFRMIIDGTPLTAKKGDILFIRDGILHGGTPDACIYECVVFDLKLLLQDNHICSKQIRSIINHTISIHCSLAGKDPSLLQTADHIFHALREKKNGYEFITQGALYQLFGIILEEHLYDETALPDAASQHHILDFKNVLHYIEEHYTESISLEELAKQAGLSPKYFCRFFRDMTNRTPIDYLNYYRIECACEQLSTTRTSITEVALNCGFNDTSYFSKLFRRYKGITPRQYLNRQFG